MFKYRSTAHHVRNAIVRTLYTHKSERNFVDSIKCVATGGSGGNGSVNFRREAHSERGGPDGGDGGRGGNIIIRTNPNVRSLSHIGYYQVAKSGEKGSVARRKGKDGKDITLEVPVGTVIHDLDTNTVIGDVSTPEHEIVVARGGIGGKGNVHFATATNRAPRYATQGKEGEKRNIRLVLKSIADVGLVGYPNAGKSTFMGSVSAAKPKVAPYPFTTLHPTVAEIVLDDFSVFTLADIPGLIEGAHVNIGLGHDFLRHIERTKILMYVIDIAGLEGMGMQPQPDGTIKYEFKNLDHNPEALINQEYNEYVPTYNKNLEIADRTRKADIINTKDSVLDDYGIDDEEDEEPMSGKKTLSDRRLKKAERKKRLYLQKRITTIEDQFDDIFSEISVDTKSYKEKVQEDNLKQIEEEKLREHYRQNRKQLLQPWEILAKLEYELEQYIPGLSKRAKLIIANKIDLPGAAKNLEILKTKTKLPIFPVSAAKGFNVIPALHYLKKLLLEQDESMDKINKGE